MAFSITGDKMIIAHTEVGAKLAGQGIGKQLIGEMVTYVRGHNLKVIPVCPYVHALFQRNPEEYSDIWHQH
jgi:predicted GNAT family acetyltransferase